MPEAASRPAVVSADDVVAVVDTYADRLHDAVRRLGCPPSKAADVMERSALEMIEALRRSPDTVTDLVGWWLARIADNTTRVTGQPNSGLAATIRRGRGEAMPGVLHGTQGEKRLADALAQLDARPRTAILLRDAYDLSPESLAVAFRRDEPSVMRLIADGRYQLLTAYGEPPTSALDAAHTGGTPVDAGALAGLADDSLSSGTAGELRRHTKRCSTCHAILADQTRARRIAAALPLVPMPEGARDSLVAAISARAAAVLPSAAEALYSGGPSRRRGPLIPIPVIIGAIAVAVVLGAVVGIASAPGGGVHTTAGLPSSGSTSTPTTTPSAGKTSAKPSASASASTTAHPTTTPPTTPTPSGSQSTTPPAGSADISVEPSRGPNGRTITVTGSGWQPGVTVSVTYYTGLGQPSSQAQATPGSNGHFTVFLAAEDPTLVPGNHRIYATNGNQSATAFYNASA